MKLRDILEVINDDENVKIILNDHGLEFEKTSSVYGFKQGADESLLDMQVTKIGKYFCMLSYVGILIEVSSAQVEVSEEVVESKGSIINDSEQISSLDVDLSKDELIINGKAIKDRPVVVTLPGPDGWPVCKLYNPKLATGKQEECDKLTVTYTLANSKL